MSITCTNGTFRDEVSGDEFCETDSDVLDGRIVHFLVNTRTRTTATFVTDLANRPATLA